MNLLTITKQKQKVADRKIVEQCLYVPSTFDLYNTLPDKEKKHIDKYAFFTHYLYMSRVFNRTMTRLDYVSVHADTMRKFLTIRRYEAVRDFWITQGVIETDGHYVPGDKSKGFRFTAAYRDVKSMDISVFDEVFGRRLVTLRIRNIERLDMSLPQHAYLLHNLQDIRIDTKRAYSHLLGDVAADATNFEESDRRHHAINAIVNKEWFCVRDESGRRVHNNYVNLSKEIKPYVYLHHDVLAKLFNLDIASSQPLLLVVLLVKKYGASFPTDAALYRHHCESGTLYAYLMEKMGYQHLTKQAFKPKVFTWFYAENHKTMYTPDFKKFANIFPTVAAFIVAYKEHDHKALSRDMQRIESGIMIDDVVNKLAVHYPSSWALTIHDSVTCTEDMVDIVYNLMLEAFQRHGVNPTITPEQLN